MEMLAGGVLVLFLELLGWIAWRTWHRTHSAPPQQPATRAQWGNKAAFDHQEQTTPKVMSLRLQRRLVRGPRRGYVERDYNAFE